MTNFGRIQRHFAKPFLKLEKMAEALPLAIERAQLEVKKQLLLNMVDVIQCFVCKMPPSTLTIQYVRCTNMLKQHLICRLCINARKYCGCANVSYGNCGLVAKLMKEIGLVICRNKNNGCQEVKSHVEMLEHEQECQFRIVQCIDCTCTEKIIFWKYLDTFKASHPSKNYVRNGYKQAIPLPFSDLIMYGGGTWTFIITGKSSTFFNVVWIQNASVRIWFYIFGSPNETQHFRYELKIKKEPGKDLNFFGKVRSINEDYATFLESDDTFEISLGMVKKYRKYMKTVGGVEGDFLDYSFSIRNLKEEAKDEDFESGIDDSD